MKKEMLINVLQPEECRIAIVEDGILEELYVERTSHESYVGNIYKGRIVNIEPSIQAAFVDFGVGRNGFLHVSDVEPEYYRHLESRSGNEGRRPSMGRDRYRSGPRDSRPEEEREPSPRRPPEARAPESSSEEPSDRGPKRRRGRRGRRDGGKSGRPEAERGPEEAAGGAAPPSEHHPEPDLSDLTFERPDSPPAESPEPERPRPMDFTERRTDEDDPPAGSVEPNPDDDLLFFPRSETAGAGSATSPPAAEPPRHHPAPERERFAERPAEEVPAFNAAAEECPPEPQTFTDTFEDDEPLPGGEEEEEDDTFSRHEEAVDDLDHDADDFVLERAEGFEEEGPPQRRPGGDRRGGERRDDRRGRRPGGGARRGPAGARNGFGRPKPLIQDVFKRGQEVLVQVIKEGIGTKGPTLSTYISIAGRYLVLMPGLNRIGVSRKINDEEQRRRLREILNELKPPKGIGFIIRTAGLDKNKKELQRDLAYLSRLWQVVVRRIRKLKSPVEIYQESDMITRTIRDTFTNDVDTIWVDEPTAFEHAQEFLQIVMPRYASRIKLYGDTEPLFHKYGIESEIARIQLRHVPLPHGGSIVIEQTEALVAIDVNSGNFRADNNAEETAYQMNLQAAKEIARQLRLRDLGGVIVNDFIDMREEKHRRGVEKAMHDAVRRDRARTKILKISQFGLIEMTRQRIRPSLKRSVYQDCHHCSATGQVKTTESMSIDVMRLIQLAAHREHVARVDVRVAEDVANYLLNKKRKEIARLEEHGEIQVHVVGTSGPPETLGFVCTDNNNNEVKFMPYEESRPPRRR